MPRYIEIGKPSAHKYDFLVGGELVVPSAASYSLYAGDGDIVEGLEDVEITLTDSSTSASLTIPEEANTTDTELDQRFIVLKFTYSDAEHVIEDYYLLRSVVRVPVSPSEVKVALGINPQDLPDDFVDVLAAYDAVADEASSLNLPSILASGGSSTRVLIDAIKYQAAVNTANTIEMAMMLSEQADNTVYKRFSNIDFDKLRSRLLGQYKKCLAQLTATTSTGGTAVTLSLLAYGTDPVTNT